MILDSAVVRMAALLKKRRHDRRISQRQLADWAGVNHSVVVRAERGKDACLATWDKLFGALGERLEFDSTESSEDAGGLLAEKAERRRERRLEGLMARFGRR